MVLRESTVIWTIHLRGLKVAVVFRDTVRAPDTSQSNTATHSKGLRTKGAGNDGYNEVSTHDEGTPDRTIRSVQNALQESKRHSQRNLL